MNLQEDYCSFELSKLLKEKGFDGLCYTYYPRGVKDKYNISMLADNHNKHSETSRPTLQLAMRWLREKHNIHIAVDRGIEHYFAVLTKLKPYQDLTMKNDVFDTYEEAVEAALKYCLTELI